MEKSPLPVKMNYIFVLLMIWATLAKMNTGSSVVYTRWGKETCPSGAELVLSGFTGGSWYDHRGAAVEPLCLPKDPQWGVYKNGVDKWRAFVFGAEYETQTFTGSTVSLQHHDVPCAVCLTRGRSVIKMFPARRTCYSGWKLEYQGYLMAGYHSFPAGTQYTCIDSNADTLHGGQSEKNGMLFYYVEARCGSLKCPPYVEGRELTCVVCSKE
nr:short-chain collagen C4-like isoform X3 [Crassostrea virginica]